MLAVQCLLNVFFRWRAVLLDILILFEIVMIHGTLYFPTYWEYSLERIFIVWKLRNLVGHTRFRTIFSKDINVTFPLLSISKPYHCQGSTVFHVQLFNWFKWLSFGIELCLNKPNHMPNGMYVVEWTSCHYAYAIVHLIRLAR